MGVDLFLLPLIEALALFWGLVGGLLVDVAEELRHLYEVPAGFPVLPANFASGEQSSKVEGKQEETLTMFLQEPSLGIELSFLSLLLYLRAFLFVNLADGRLFLFEALESRNSRLLLALFINLLFLEGVRGLLVL